MTANGRLQASYSAAMVVGPLLAGVLVAVVELETVFLVDAASFVGSAVSLGARADELQPRRAARAKAHPARRQRRAPLCARPSRAAEHLADDGADQLRLGDDVHAARPLRVGGARRDRHADRGAVRRGRGGRRLPRAGGRAAPPPAVVQRRSARSDDARGHARRRLRVSTTSMPSGSCSGRRCPVSACSSTSTP